MFLDFSSPKPQLNPPKFSLYSDFHFPVNLQMITCAFASPAAISSGVCFCRRNVSCNSGFSARYVSAHRKQFPLVSTLNPIEKDVGRSFQAFNFLGKVLVHAVATKVESDYEVDVQTQNFKSTGALVSTFKDVITSDPEPSSGAKTSKKERNSKRLNNSASQIKKPDHLPVIRYPLGTESAIKAILECNTLVFVVDKHADKKIIKDTVKTMFKVRAKKVNTLIMPDGTKRAYIMLAQEYKALDVAKKIIIL